MSQGETSIRNTDPDHTDLQASAADATDRPDATESKPKRKPRSVPKAPKAPADPTAAERHRLAEEIVRWWWNGLQIKPAGKNAWFASVASVEACLKVGWHQRDVANALRAAGSPVTIPRLEIELKRHGRPPGANGSNDQHLADEMAWARQMEAEAAAADDDYQQPDIWEEIPA